MPKDDISPPLAGQQQDTAAQAQSDTERHTLGYGHRAHQPDPNAKYGFESPRIRPLPVDPKDRWR